MPAPPSPPRPSRRALPRRAQAWRVLAIAALGVNLWVLYAPRVAGPELPGVRLDWVGHALTFAALAFTALMARLPPAVVLPAAAANAAVSELVQHWFLPARTGDVTDLLADFVGIALGWSLWRIVLTRGAARSRPDPGP